MVLVCEVTVFEYGVMTDILPPCGLCFFRKCAVFPGASWINIVVLDRVSVLFLLLIVSGFNPGPGS